MATLSNALHQDSGAENLASSTATVASIAVLEGSLSSAGQGGARRPAKSKASNKTPQAASGPSSRRLQKELMELYNDPPPNCSAKPKGDNLYEWTSTIMGPEGSVYESGIFHLDISFSQDYPFKPPKVVFRTRIYHCNISTQGSICLDVLKDKWSPAMTVSKVLLSISALLADCNPADPLVAPIAQQYRTERDQHDRTARLWTQRYAL